MPKFKPTFDGAGVEPSAGFNNYDGPTPPAGTYRMVTKRGTIKENNSGDDMLTVIMEIDEPKGSPKAKYNGAALFWNGNFTEKGAPFVNKWAQACGFPITAIWRGGIVLSQDDTPLVLKIGKMKFAGVHVNAKVSRREWPAESGEFRLNGQDFFPAKASDSDDDDDDDDDDVDQSFSEDDDDTDDYDDDDAGDDEDDEPEPEPVKPAKRTAKKAAPAKVAATKRRKPAPVEVDDDDEDSDDDDEDDESF